MNVQLLNGLIQRHVTALLLLAVAIVCTGFVLLLLLAKKKLQAKH